MKSACLFIVFAVCSHFCVAQSGQNGYRVSYTSMAPRPDQPAKLEVPDMMFSDKGGNGNNILDAYERGEITFYLENNGNGNAYKIEIDLKERSGIKGVNFFSRIHVGDLPSGKSTRVSIPVYAAEDLATGKATIELTINEANGFGTRDPMSISFRTQAFRPPHLDIADFMFTNKLSEGRISLGEMTNLTMIVQNKGQGTASDVIVSLGNPKNVFPAGDTKFLFKLLKPNETKTITYSFFTNTQYRDSLIPIDVTVTERSGRYGIEKPLSVSLDQTLTKTLQVEVEAPIEAEVPISEISLRSDIDKNIPDNKRRYENRYALIIGNEDYSSRQNGLDVESNVEFANNDARTFRQYCINTMGVPEDNAMLLLDATAGKMNQAIDKLSKLIKVNEGSAEVVVYYAGHGYPDEQTKQAYLIPVDVTGSDLQTAVRLQSLYAKLTEFPAKRVTVFLDACFTGGGRNQGLVASRAIKVKPAAEVLSGNLVVFTATNSDESSLPWKEKNHGMFTYLLLKNIQQTKGKISYEDLFTKLKTEVSLNAIKVNSKSQTPNLLTSNQIADNWKNWTIE
jgi:hypothetical protein